METLTLTQHLTIIGIIIFLFWLLLKSIKWMNMIVKQEECQHLNRFTHVQRHYATCEETTETCLECGKILSQKTDCI